MPAAYAQPHAYGARRSPASRAISALLALGIGALLILGLVSLGVFPDRKRESDILATFDVRPPAPVETRGAKQAQQAQATKQAETRPPPVPLPPPPPAPFPDIIMMNSRDFAAADIGRIQRSPLPSANESADSGAADAGTGDTVGKGPDGQPMYAARWYREPTRAEMITYLPKRRMGGNVWGLIVCRTVERYRVEDCHELGESPGSGMAGAVRQAAWQFLIRPPRKGGQPMIGAWVRIRYELIEESPAE